MNRLRIQTTPNPNSLKFTSTDRPFLAGGMESFNTPQEASGHPLGERLFALPGVANVFILPDFLTVTKHPATHWDELIPKVEEAIASYYAEQT